ncbi:MAG: hypothetical protein JWP15_862 [Alphaproteobacteria bacterium]|nr:hypothetical protein [Alphaproteobacteria bacterium]
MIFHFSISSDTPAATAAALAEILGGTAMPFPPVGIDSWIAISGDGRGTAIEVYARGWRIEPGEQDAPAVGRFDEKSERFGPVHFAVGTSLDEAEVRAIAAREGWRATYDKRGNVFGVIELWVDNALMIEVLTAEMQAEYLGAMNVQSWAKMLAAADDSRLAA